MIFHAFAALPEEQFFCVAIYLLCWLRGAGLGIPGLLSSPMRIRKTTMVNQERNKAAVAPQLASDVAVEDLAFC